MLAAEEAGTELATGESRSPRLRHCRGRLTPMLLSAARNLPSGDGWAFEPKWDGFRCLVHLGEDTHLQSRRGWDLTRFENVSPVPIRPLQQRRAFVSVPWRRVTPKRCEDVAFRATKLASAHVCSVRMSG
jgi:hypothetical protein